MTNRSCLYCPAVLTNSRAIQCGAPECVRQQRNARARRNQGAARAASASRGESYRNRWARPEGPRKSNTHCVDCGAPVGWGTTQETRCRKHGREHHVKRKAAEARAEAARRRALREKELAEYNRRPARARRRLAAAAVGMSANPRWKFAAGPCHRCGEHFVCRVTKSLPQYCSKKCANQEAKDRRRALEAGVVILPAQRWRIYKRDDYCCKLCGRRVDRKAAPGSDDEPTIDHVIPLSRGGAHAPANWQTAHRLCNSKKRDLFTWIPEMAI